VRAVDLGTKESQHATTGWNYRHWGNTLHHCAGVNAITESMPCDLAVVGASAGGVKAPEALVHSLPVTLPAAVWVVLHVPAWRKSAVPEILARAGALPAAHAVDGELITPSLIYVAPPDLHMLINGERIELWRGPRGNRHRPAVNTLFRSAATAYKRRVAGVMLSGAQDDGAAGLWWIKRYSMTVAQDPYEAEHSSMPQTAIDAVGLDYVAAVAELARQLTGSPSACGSTTPRSYEGGSELG
jgi:two-component system chemotaxis response regulator CheB